MHVSFLICHAADPSTKIMISHGGYMTLQETIYHGVTYLGLPTMGKQSDRSRNVRLAAYRGIGLYFDEDANRTKSLILDKLNRLLHDSTYVRNVIPLKDAGHFLIQFLFPDLG